MKMVRNRHYNIGEPRSGVQFCPKRAEKDCTGRPNCSTGDAVGRVPQPRPNCKAGFEQKLRRGKEGKGREEKVIATATARKGRREVCALGRIPWRQGARKPYAIRVENLTSRIFLQRRHGHVLLYTNVGFYGSLGHQPTWT